ncbi:MAG: glycoside hydrolase family 15 protein, partial [Dongiaceae bacterium]
MSTKTTVAGKIEDYALIGDCHSAALIGRNGSVDWLCWPRFDSAACFAALLGTADNGRWLIAPTGAVTQTSRAYLDQTLMLETRFSTETGEVSIIDFMTPRDDCANLIRLVVGQEGQVPMRMELVLRFDYGETMPWVEKLTDGSGVSAVAGPDCVVLRTPVEIRGEDFRTVADFSVQAGDVIPFVLTHTASHLPLSAPFDVAAAKEQTMAFWRDWSAQSTYRGPWQDAVTRSLITLKALTYAPTGGIVAAPTTSLPEKIGGVRTWDYRFCWVRDATLTLLALMHTGYYEEAEAWRSWLLRAIAGNPAQMQIMYSIAGERRLPEMTLDWLSGYENSMPVRIGNGAAGQRQLDVYGEMMDALYQGRQGNLQENDTVWRLQVALVEHLEEIWQEPDDGIWESRGGRQHFTLSKVMTWVAFDRGIKSVEKFGFKAPLEKWRALREVIHADVC